jgi:DNA-binding transcriptional regulator YiaG
MGTTAAQTRAGATSVATGFGRGGWFLPLSLGRSPRHATRDSVRTVARRLLSPRTMPENTKNLIRSLRQQLGMTQEEFAHEIAVTVSTVNRWENSHAEPSKLAWKAIRELGKTRGLQVSEALGAD